MHKDKDPFTLSLNNMIQNKNIELTFKLTDSLSGLHTPNQLLSGNPYMAEMVKSKSFETLEESDSIILKQNIFHFYHDLDKL